MALKNNTWKLNQWYDQDVAGNVTYSGIVEMWIWGENDDGRLGLNDTNYRSSPVQIPGTTWDLDNVALDSDGMNGCSWIKTDGTMWTWGRAHNGGLGLNQSNVAISSPTQLGSETTWRSVSRDSQNVLATKTDGSLWAWGWNQHGRLGQNNTVEYSSPVQIGSDTNWTATGIAAGGRCSFGMKTDGTAWAWGYNDKGQLGHNNTTHYSSPVQLTGSWSKLSGSWEQCGGIKTDGTLWVMGRNNNGELGQNDVVYRSSPVQIPGTNWGLYSAGYHCGAATKTDGTLWTWGVNLYGSLGLNQATPVKLSSPTQLPGTNWTNSAGGYNFGVALKDL